MQYEDFLQYLERGGWAELSLDANAILDSFPPSFDQDFNQEFYEKEAVLVQGASISGRMASNRAACSGERLSAARAMMGAASRRSRATAAPDRNS